jgi:hypothetical protein
MPLGSVLPPRGFTDVSDGSTIPFHASPVTHRVRIRPPSLFKAKYSKFTASFSEWDANRVVLERQAFYVRWARRRASACPAGWVHCAVPSY